MKSEIFYRALRLRYGNVKINKWTDPSTCRTLEHISEPFLAPFVRCIKIDFEARVDELLDMALDIFGGKSSKLTSSGDMNRDYIIALVSAMRSNLTSLDLSLSTTDIEEICDLISQLRFGQLKHLGLRLPCNRSHTSLTMIDENRNPGEFSISPTLETDLAIRNDQSWTLDDIGIWRGGSQDDWNIMNTFARHVPSFIGFWGNGHKEVP
ncbi:hypothetical protein Ac2012v2_002264 [Leucoagaricus gongylophorus]